MTQRSYFVLEVVDMQPNDVEWLQISFNLNDLGTDLRVLNGTYDENFVFCIMPLTSNALYGPLINPKKRFPGI